MGASPIVALPFDYPPAPASSYGLTLYLQLLEDEE